MRLVKCYICDGEGEVDREGIGICRCGACVGKGEVDASKFNNIHEAFAGNNKSEAVSWVPIPDQEFDPTGYFAGSPDKIELLRSRLEQGLPLHHPEDCKFVYREEQFDYVKGLALREIQSFSPKGTNR